VVVDAKTLCAPHHIACKARILVRHQRGHAQQTFSLVTSTTPVTSDGMPHPLHPTPMPLSTVAELVPSPPLRLITIPFNVNLGTGSTLPPRVFPQPALKVDDVVIARVPLIADEILADLHLNLTGGHVSGIDVALFTVHITLGQEVIFPTVTLTRTLALALTLPRWPCRSAVTRRTQRRAVAAHSISCGAIGQGHGLRKQRHHIAHSKGELRRGWLGEISLMRALTGEA